MKKTQIETFRQALVDASYRPPRGKSNTEKIDRACRATLEDGPIWYADFLPPLKQHITQLYRSREILRTSYLRRDAEREGYDQQVRDATHHLAFNQLRAVRTSSTRSFNVKSVYEILKEFHGLAKLDIFNLVLDISEDTSVARLNALLKKAEEFNEKKIGRHPFPVNLDWIKKSINEGKEDYWQYRQAVERLPGIYQRLLGSRQIAFIQQQDAIEFLEPYVSPSPKEARRVIVSLKLPNE